MWLCRRKEPSDQVARWLKTLAEFKYTLAHRAGPKHGNADGLSRRPCGDCRQCQKIKERDGGPTWCELITETEGQLLVEKEDDGTVTIEARPIQEVAPDPSQLAKEQPEGHGAVATMYKAIQTSQDLFPGTDRGRESGAKEALSKTDLHAVNKAMSVRDSSGNQ